MILRLVAFVIPLGLDTFAVSTALGLRRVSPRQRLRISLSFAAFESLAPAVGLLVGSYLGHAIGEGADYLAGGLLIAYATFALLRSDDEDESEAAGKFTTAHGWALVLLGLSVSLDELAVGFTLGLSRVHVIPALILIAAQAFLVTQLGIRVGARISQQLRHRSERLAGVVLGLLGLWLILQQLFVR